jgi:protein-L-isoaspartate(D-aspartate) O-methyltransferase
MKKNMPIEFGSAQPFTWDHQYLNKVLSYGKSKIVTSPNLKSAFYTIDRADFIPEKLRDHAYEDRDLETGWSCILNKPTTVALMLQLLNPGFQGNFLDIGTGTGYAAALLGVAAGPESKVFSLERVQFLVDIARINIAKYPFLKNVEINLKDGYHGLKERAPFDGIHIAAAYDEVPVEITNQLKIGGRLVAPTTKNSVHLIERLGKSEFRETIHKAFFFDKIKEGIE